MGETINNESNDDISNNNSLGTASKNNFLGFLPLPYSMSTFKSSLPTSLSSSNLNTHASLTLTNNNENNNNIRPTYSSFTNLSSIENRSNLMYRKTSLALTKPVSLFSQTREKERFELSTLNDKFADYVEKVRYLESQNKKIQIDTNFLTEKQNDSCQRIKTLFEQEISQLKQLTGKLFQEKNNLFSSSRSAQNSNSTLKHDLNLIFKQPDSSKYETEKIERQLSSTEGDILMYTRRLAHQDDEHTQWKRFITHIQRLLLQGKNEIHNEILTRQSYEQTKQHLSIDLAKLQEQHQQKLKDLKQTSFQLNSNSSNDRAHSFKSELSNAIRRIRQDFDRENDLFRNQLYGQFTQTYENIFRQYPEFGHLFLNEREQERIKQEEERLRSEIELLRHDTNLLKQKNSDLKLRIREYQINIEMTKDENKRIQEIQENDINQIKLKQEQTIKDYDNVLSKQTTLEKEIETYRNLLEGTMKPVVDNITDEYNKNEKQNQVSNKNTSPSKVHSTNSNENNSYVSYATLNSSNNQVDDSSTNPNANHFETTKNLNEKNETNNIRPPIVIQTRRNH